MPNISLREKLVPYQKKGYRKGIRKEGFALVAGTGTGKTILSLAMAETRRVRGHVKKLLVIAPLTAASTQWPSEILKHPPGFRAVERLSEVAGAPDPVVFIINYDMVRRYPEDFLAIKWDMVIADEAHALKNRNSQQFKVMRKLCDRTRFRLFLTATPLESNAVELWALMRLIDHRVFGKTWKPFERRFCRVKKQKIFQKGTAQVQHILKKPYLRKDKEREVMAMIRPYFYLKEADSVLKLEYTDTRMLCPMLPKQRAFYEQMKKHQVIRLKDFASLVKIQATLSMRLQQISGGFIKGEEKEDLKWVGSGKYRAFRKLVDSYFQPEDRVLVFARYTPEVEKLAAFLAGRGKSFRIIQGKNKKTRPEDVEAFQRGEVQYLVLQTKAGGASLDLQVANKCVVYSKTQSRIDNMQMRGRPLRRGQERPVEFIHLLSDLSVDLLFEDDLQTKSNFVQRLYRHIQEDPTMAAKKTATKKAASKKAAPKKAAAKKEAKTEDKPEFGVDYIAEQLGIEPASARVRLRNKGIEKSGRSYGWDSKTAADKVVKQLTAE